MTSDHQERAAPANFCATEGCERPATCHFERKGVGSYYCGECFGKIIEAVERAAPAQQPVAVSEAEIKAFRDKYRQMWPGSGLDRQSIVELLTASKEAVAAASEAFRSTFTALATTPSEPELRAEIVRLTRERDAARRMIDGIRGKGVSMMCAEALDAQLAAEARAKTAEQERDELRAKLAEAREVIEPFAKQADEFHRDWPDSMRPICDVPEEDPEDDGNGTFTLGDLRRARAFRDAIRSRAALDKGATE